MFHFSTLIFPITLLDFSPLPFLYPKGSDKYTFLCLPLQLGLSNRYGLSLMCHFFPTCGLHIPLWQVSLPSQSKSKSTCILQPPLTKRPGSGCVSLLCPDGFPVWLRGLFLQETPQLPLNPGICSSSLQPPPKHVTNTYLPLMTPYKFFESTEFF